MSMIHRLFCLLQRRKTLFAALFLLFIIVFGGRAVAQSDSLPTADDFSSAINSAGENLQKFNYRTMLYVAESVNCMGGVIKDCGEEQSSQSNSRVPRQNTAFGAGMRLIGLLTYRPPLSSTEYLAHVGQRLRVVPRVLAVGQGAIVLSPVLKLWTIMRNLAYLFFIVFFIVVGFMILFQSHINQQTIIGVQHALPQIVVTLLLITFSYALAGMMVDLANLFNRFILVVFDELRMNCPSGIPNIDCFIAEKYTLSGQESNVNIFTLMYSLNQTQGISNVIERILSSFGDTLPFVGALGTVAGLIFTITLLGAVFRTFFALITAYVTIIITTIISPLQLLGMAIPGGKEGLSSFIKTFMSNILVFPVSFILLLLAAYFVGASDPPWAIDPSFSQAFNWYPLPLGYFSAVGNTINNLLAFGILLMLPNVPQIIKENLQVKEKAGVGGGLEGLRSAAKNIPIIGQFLG